MCSEKIKLPVKCVRGKLLWVGQSFLKQIAVFSIMISFFVTIGTVTSAENVETQAKKEAKAMVLAMQSSLPDSAIPPIDASAPSKVETATFALG